MDETTDREREVANALYQIEKLKVDDVRAVLRYLATDDATFSEAQCSHIAGVIDGTLYNKARDAVNANMTCMTGLAAALKWEQTYTGHASKGHVSGSLREYADAATTPKIEILPTRQPRATTSGDQDTRDDDDCVGEVLNDAFNSAVPTNITNRGHLMIHYHYN